MSLITNGWAGIAVADEAFSKIEREFVPFKIVGAGPDKVGPPVWRLYRRLNGGKDNITFEQKTGDCTSMGVKHVLEYTAAADSAVYSKPVSLKSVFAPYIYGVSRTASDCGDGKLGRSAGSTGAWVALAAKKYGVLFDDDEGVPAYSGKLADQWGSSGVPKKFYTEASDNLVRSTARIETVDQLRDALINYHLATIASSWAFKVSKKDGVKCYVHNPADTWMHQMCFIAWRDDPFPAAFRLNSWGDSTGAPVEDEPIGGAWQSAESIEKELKTGVELYVYSSFDGFPSAGSVGKYSFV